MDSMAYENTILIKIDKKTKSMMNRSRENWSAKIRSFIASELERKARFSEAEKIRNSLFRRSPGPQSVAAIRRMRASRHGTSSN